MEKYKKITEYWENNLCDGGNEDFPFVRGKVLEIGCGSGNDALRFISQGADYTGIDLTDNAVFSTQNKIGKYGKVFRMNAERLNFPNNTFDLVYSWGVIHHTLNPKRVIREIHRVLKPYGEIYLMVYNKCSLRYFEICVLRKILWKLNYPKFREIKKLIPHPTKEQWISINTDNIGCPLSRVYSKKEALYLVKDFRFLSTYTRNLGWFRIIKGSK